MTEPVSSSEPVVPFIENGEVFAQCRPQDSVISFTTSKGSVYTYDEEGHTTRVKTVIGEELPKQDITVFIDVGVRDLVAVAASYLLMSSTKGTKIQVIEQQADGQIRVITDIKDVHDPNNTALATLKNGQVLRSKPAALFPEVGKHVFDARQFDDNGVMKTERHLGHQVTTIRYTD